MFDGAGGEVEDVAQGDQGPDAGEDLPVGDAEHSEEQGGKEDHAHRAPAVKGMKQAHYRVLVIKRTGLHNRAGQHLDQAAAHGVDDDADHNAREGIGEQIRKQGQAHEAQAAGDLGGDDAFTVTDTIHEAGAEHVHQQLRQEERCRDQGDLPQGDAQIRMEFQEKQRCEIGADRLGDEREVTGGQGPSVIFLDHFNIKARPE